MELRADLENPDRLERSRLFLRGQSVPALVGLHARRARGQGDGRGARAGEKPQRGDRSERSTSARGLYYVDAHAGDYVRAPGRLRNRERGRGHAGRGHPLLPSVVDSGHRPQCPTSAPSCTRSARAGCSSDS